MTVIKMTQFKYQVDLNTSIGHGNLRPPGSSTVPNGSTLSGVPVRVDNLTKVEIRFKLDAQTNKFVINTMFPVQ